MEENESTEGQQQDGAAPQNEKLTGADWLPGGKHYKGLNSDPLPAPAEQPEAPVDEQPEAPAEDPAPIAEEPTAEQPVEEPVVTEEPAPEQNGDNDFTSEHWGALVANQTISYDASAGFAYGTNALGKSAEAGLAEINGNETLKNELFAKL